MDCQYKIYTKDQTTSPLLSLHFQTENHLTTWTSLVLGSVKIIDHIDSISLLNTSNTYKANTSIGKFRYQAGNLIPTDFTTGTQRFSIDERKLQPFYVDCKLLAAISGEDCEPVSGMSEMVILLPPEPGRLSAADTWI